MKFLLARMSQLALPGEQGQKILFDPGRWFDASADFLIYGTWQSLWCIFKVLYWTNINEQVGALGVGEKSGCCRWKMVVADEDTPFTAEVPEMHIPTVNPRWFLKYQPLSSFFRKVAFAFPRVSSAVTVVYRYIYIYIYKVFKIWGAAHMSSVSQFLLTIANNMLVAWIQKIWRARN